MKEVMDVVKSKFQPPDINRSFVRRLFAPQPAWGLFCGWVYFLGTDIPLSNSEIWNL